MGDVVSVIGEGAGALVVSDSVAGGALSSAHADTVAVAAMSPKPPINSLAMRFTRSLGFTVILQR